MHTSRKKHILVISQYFYPEQFRINDICKEWIKRGYKVTVITGIPNYPQGKFYSGYGWLNKRRENYEGIQIIRLPIVPRGSNKIMLVLNYISFVISGGIWSVFAKTAADVVFIFEVSPMTQALVGAWYGKRRAIPCFIYVQDLWPENVEVVIGLHNKWVINAINRMVDYIYRNCKYIFATSPSFVRKIEERKTAFHSEKSKVIYWPQYAEDFYQPVNRKPLLDMNHGDTFKIIFTGNIGYAQGLEILPETAGILKKKGILCEFYIIGDGRYRQEFERCISKNQVTDCFYLLGRKDPEEIPYYLANSDAAFLSFTDNPLWGMTIPAKLQSYMACGIPIIAAASGETKRIIEQSASGFVCKIGDRLDLAASIEKIIKQPKQKRLHMGENARRYYEIYFSKAKLLNEIETYLF